MADHVLKDYFDALSRISEGRQRVIEKGRKISLEAVAVEAGRKPGAIKRSRALYAPLIAKIEHAALQQKDKVDPRDRRIELLEDELEKYRALYEEALGREIVLSAQILDLLDHTDDTRTSGIARNRT